MAGTIHSHCCLTFHTNLNSLFPPLLSVLSLPIDDRARLLPTLRLSPLPYFSICLILARPLTHKSNTGHLNTICLLPMESGMGCREQRRGSMAPLTVSPLSRFRIHLPIASSASSPLPLFALAFFVLLFKRKKVGTMAPNADAAILHSQIL